MVELSNYILVEYYNEEVTDEEWAIVDKRSDWQQKAGNGWNPTDIDEEKQNAILKDWQEALKKEPKSDGTFTRYTGEKFDYEYDPAEWHSWYVCSVRLSLITID